MTDHLIDEVNEDMRRQELMAFWVQNRVWVIGGIVLAILMTAGMTFWRGHEARQNMAMTASLMEAATASDVKKLDELVTKKQVDSEHAAMAQFAAAGIQVVRGEKDKAAALYDKISASSGIDKIYRDLAALYALRLRMDAEKPEKIHAGLKPLLDDKNPWRFTALETEALVFAREGKIDKAAEALEKISTDSAAPQDLRTRAMTLREFYLGSAVN